MERSEMREQTLHRRPRISPERAVSANLALAASGAASRNVTDPAVYRHYCPTARIRSHPEECLTWWRSKPELGSGSELGLGSDRDLMERVTDPSRSLGSEFGLGSDRDLMERVTDPSLSLGSDLYWHRV